MDEINKRKSEASSGGPNAKKSKQWRVSKGHPNVVASIEPGDAGIWATCEMGKEGKCTAELRDLFEEYAVKLYGDSGARVDREASDDEEAEADIEAEIRKEVQGMKSKSTNKEALFQPVKIEIQCVLFFKTREPVEPVGFVHRICQDALEGATKKHRWVKRLTPMTMIGKATVEGLEKLTQTVLQPVFHAEGTPARKFAIRPTRRNHNVMKRDEIIRQIASAVGQRHSVDLKNYDHIILVDVYRNVIGMSVVGSDFEALKQYNLAEIYNPTPKPEPMQENEKVEKAGNGDHAGAPNAGKTDEIQASDVMTAGIPNASTGDHTSDRPKETWS